MVTLNLLEGRYSVCKLPGETPIPARPAGARFWSLTITPVEVSIVCPEGYEPKGGLIEAGWRALEVMGPLDFDQIGILSGISQVLAEAGISIFALSTYNTDYIFVKESHIWEAVYALQLAGYEGELANIPSHRPG